MPSLSIEIANQSGVAGYEIGIFGSAFGAAQGSGSVEILGATSQIVDWTDTFVRAVIPAVADGVGDLVVTTDGGAQINAPFTVYSVDPQFIQPPTYRFTNVAKGKQAYFSASPNAFCFEQPSNTSLGPEFFLFDYVCGYENITNVGEAVFGLPATIAFEADEILNGDYYFQFFSNSNWYLNSEVPEDYTIEVSDDSTDGVDGSWTALTTITGNDRASRLNLVTVSGGSYQWMRLNVTSAAGGASNFKLREVRVYKASGNTNGRWDSMALYGDSLTAGAFEIIGRDGLANELGTLQNATTDFIFTPYGLSGQNSSGLVDSTSEHDIYDALTLDDMTNRATYWGIALGTNDTQDGGSQIGVSGANIEEFDNRLAAIVQELISRNRIPLIARIPDTDETLGGYGDFLAKQKALADIDAINAQYGLMPGPDLYTLFRRNIEMDSGSYFGGDGTHHTNLGKKALVDAWAAALADAIPPTSATAPLAINDAFSVDEDAVLNAASVLTNDSDPNGDSLTAVLENGASNGQLTLNVDGTFAYTPAANFSGSDSFAYRADDGTETSYVAAVAITVNAVNDAPTAADDSDSTAEDTPITIDVLANDTDVDADTLTIGSINQPGNGSATINAGAITYTPNSGFTGVDTFTYTATDGNGGQDNATVTVTVTAPNDSPTAVDDSASVDEDGSLNGSSILANDTDPEGNALTATLESDTANGQLTLNSDGTFVYTPATNFNGSDSFTYRANDGTSASDNVASVSIVVNPVNDDPTAADDSGFAVENTSLELAVLANDSDVDGDALSVLSASQPSNGTATINSATSNPNDTITYTPDPNFLGADSFTYVIADGNGGQDTATVTVSVNDPTILSYHSLYYEIDYSNLPPLSYLDLTLQIDVGNISAATVKAGGVTVPHTYDPTSGVLQFTVDASPLEITLLNPADTAAIGPLEKATLRDDKKWAWSIGFDDNTQLKPALSVLESFGYRGTLFQIGSMIDDTRIENWIIDKPDMITYLNNGWSLGNHTWDHDCYQSGDRTDTIIDGYNRISQIVSESSRADYEVISFAAPCFDAPYHPYILNMRDAGTTAVQFNESGSSFPLVVDPDISSNFTLAGKYVYAFDFDDPIHRDSQAGYAPLNTIAEIDWIAAQASSSYHFWHNSLAHGNNENDVQQVVNHIYTNYGAGGTDEAWIAPSDQIYSYLIVRDNATITQVDSLPNPPGEVTQLAPQGNVANNTLTFEWEVEPTATEYTLVVYRVTPGPGEVVFNQDYQAADVCGATECSVTPTAAELSLVAGDYTWLVRAANADGTGPWSIYQE